MAYQAIISAGGLLHKLSIEDDKQQLSLVGDFLDDTTGPPSTTILNHLVCKNSYEKDLSKILRLPSFTLVAYAKDREFRRVNNFLSYLGARNKAARVFLDSQGTIGLLRPDTVRADGIPSLRCHLPSRREDIAGTLPLNSQPTPAANKRAYSEPNEPPCKRVKHASDNMNQPRFTYVPPSHSNINTDSDEEIHSAKQVGESAQDNYPACVSYIAQTSTYFLPPELLLDAPSRFKYSPPDGNNGAAFKLIFAEEVRQYLNSSDTYRPGSIPATPSVSAVAPDISAESAVSKGNETSLSALGVDQKEAESFYNKLQRDKASRDQSLVFHLRKLNNWVKAQLINETRPADSQGREVEVLDLACGKGGDFGKWRDVAKRYPVARYVGVDIAKSSLIDAIERYQDKHVRSALGTALVLGCADLGQTNLCHDEIEVWEAMDRSWSRRPLLDEQDSFDVITMQFALHYMFEDKDRAGRFFRTVATHLRPGGCLIATTVDARVLVELLASLAELDSVSQEWVASLKDEHQRELCRLQVDSETYQRLFGPSANRNDSPYGLRYRFLLRDGVDEDGGEAVNAPEWMLPLPLLRDMAHEHGLRLLSARNFHEVVQGENRRDNAGHRPRGEHRWTNHQGTISSCEWDIARLYLALRFQKLPTQ